MPRKVGTGFPKKITLNQDRITALTPTRPRRNAKRRPWTTRAAKQKGPRKAGPHDVSTDVDRSDLEIGRQLAAIGGELSQHLLVQPDVHGRGIIGVASVMKLLGQFLAR